MKYYRARELLNYGSGRGSRAGLSPSVIHKTHQVMQIPPSLSPLTHLQASAIWENANYDEPTYKPMGWDKWSPNSSLGHGFEKEVLRLVELHKNDTEALQIIRRQHGKNFTAVLPVNVEGPLSVSEYYLKGFKRILSATERRFDKHLSLFRAIHDELQTFLLFKGCLDFRYPDYKLEEHPIFGGKFQQLFHRALMALVDWKDPWEQSTGEKCRKRDKSPVRGKLVHLIN